jgi:VanZ family protein
MLNRVIRIAAWLMLAFIASATLAPLGLRPQIAGTIAGTKIEHWAAFALLGVLFGSGYRQRFVFAAAMVLGSAILLESAQLLTSDRHARFIDLTVKLAGGLTGLGLSYAATAVLIIRGQGRRKRRVPQIQLQVRSNGSPTPTKVC